MEIRRLIRYSYFYPHQRSNNLVSSKVSSLFGAVSSMTIRSNRNRSVFIPLLLSLSSEYTTASTINTRRSAFISSSPSISRSCLQKNIVNRSKNPTFLEKASYSTTTTSLQAKRTNSSSRKGGKSKMPRGVKKENLPSKICVVCNRPFNWRKKWERCWDEVTTCSKSCNKKRREGARKEKALGTQDEDRTTAFDTAPMMSNTEQTETTTLTMAHILETSDEELRMLGTATTTSSSLGTLINEERNIDESLNEVAKAENLVVDDIEGTSNGMLQMTLQDEKELIMGNDDDSQESNNQDILEDDPVALRKAQRKAEKKAKKAARRAQREGRGDPTAGQKQCDMCSKSVDLLVRCMYEPSQTEWKMICGKCWNVASGGVVDGDAAHPHYRYGGLWKNRRKR